MQHLQQVPTRLQLHDLAAQALDGEALARVARARAPPLLLQHRLQRLRLRADETSFAEILWQAQTLWPVLACVAE